MTALPTPRSWNNRPRLLALLAAFWGAEMLLALACGAAFLSAGDGLPLWMQALVLLFTCFLALVGLRLGLLCLFQLRLPNPVLALSPQGLLDRRLSPTPIPWREVTWVAIFRIRGTQVVFELSPAGRARIRQPEHLFARINRAMLMPAYTLMPMGTEARAEELAEAMRAWFDATRPAPAGAGADHS